MKEGTAHLGSHCSHDRQIIKRCRERSQAHTKKAFHCSAGYLLLHLQWLSVFCERWGYINRRYAYRHGLNLFILRKKHGHLFHLTIVLLDIAVWKKICTPED